MGHETIAKFLKFASLLYLKQRKMSILRNKKRHHRVFSGRVLMNIAISLLVSKCWFYKWNPRGMLVVLYGFRCSHRFWSQSRVMLVTCSIQLIGFREMKPENPMIFMGKSGWFPVKIFPSTNPLIHALKTPKINHQPGGSSIVGSASQGWTESHPCLFWIV